jgi:hypothetical protein
MNAKAALINRFYSRLCDFATFVEKFASRISFSTVSNCEAAWNPVTWEFGIFSLGQSLRDSTDFAKCQVLRANAYFLALARS